MRDDVRLELRISKELKEKFTVLCDDQGVKVSAKLKSMIIDELVKDITKFSEKSKNALPTVNNPSEKPSISPVSISESIQATTLPLNIKTPLNAVKTENSFNSLFDLIDDDTEVNLNNLNTVVRSAINASKKRKFPKKKRK